MLARATLRGGSNRSALQVVCRAANSSPAQRGEPLPQQRTRRPEQERLRVIRLISACVEANASVIRFENLAGRSAMVGFLAAFLVELVVDGSGLFGNFGPEQASQFAACTALLVSVAAAVAASSTRTLGRRFSEAVLASMTAVQRSRSSVTVGGEVDQVGGNVDKAVDFVLDKCIPKGLLFMDDERNV